MFGDNVAGELGFGRQECRLNYGKEPFRKTEKEREIIEDKS
jgi:hypothetical protein